MTFYYKNIYINATSTVAGSYENNGPLSNYFDKTYEDFYVGENSWETAEVRLIKDSIDIVLNKLNKKIDKVELFISGDLLNQLVASNYTARDLNIPFLGIYNACATSIEGLIIGASLISGGFIKNCICSTSSHNNAAEKQFRYPVEYGGIKPLTTTFTATGGVSAYISKKRGGIKIESSTIGKVVDKNIKDPYHMGACMAASTADVISKHLNDTKRDSSYYDLILTGDLGMYGSLILNEYLNHEYNIKMNNHRDSGCMLYDKKMSKVYAGASGPSCLPLVSYSYIFDLMKKKQYRRVLLVATGALMNSNMVNQKLSIPCIAHAISLEV